MIITLGNTNNSIYLHLGIWFSHIKMNNFDAAGRHANVLR